MRRIQYHQYGGPETMRLEEFELAAPKKGEVAVRVSATSVNPIDWKLRQGQLKMMTGRSFPRTMGSDFAGTVLAVGEGVTQFAEGDEVFGIARLKESGAFGEAVITTEDFLAHRPDGLSIAQAATLPTGATMGWLGLVEQADVQPNQRVFVAGCTGGVGEAAVQIARLRGATVDGSCSAAQQPRARDLGVAEVNDYATYDPALSAGAYDVVYDTAGTLPVKTAMQMLTKHGTFLDINATPRKFLHSALVRRHKIFFCTPTTELLTHVAKAATDGSLTASIGTTTDLDGAIGIIGQLENGLKISGKALIEVRR